MIQLQLAAIKKAMMVRAEQDDIIQHVRPTVLNRVNMAAIKAGFIPATDRATHLSVQFLGEAPHAICLNYGKRLNDAFVGEPQIYTLPRTVPSVIAWPASENLSTPLAAYIDRYSITARSLGAIAGAKGPLRQLIGLISAYWPTTPSTWFCQFWVLRGMAAFSGTKSPHTPGGDADRLTTSRATNRKLFWLGVIRLIAGTRAKFTNLRNRVFDDLPASKARVANPAVAPAWLPFNRNPIAGARTKFAPRTMVIFNDLAAHLALIGNWHFTAQRAMYHEPLRMARLI